jgi:hypothetical protein
MRTGLTLLALSSLLIMPSIIPGHSEGSQQVMPKRGFSMEAVLGKFGEPDQRFGPIGEPPITEWVYGSFRVYFEHRTVLHSIDLDTLIFPSQ